MHKKGHAIGRTPLNETRKHRQYPELALRNHDCRLYSGCLDVAAHLDIELSCSGCHLEADHGGKITVENFGRYEVDRDQSKQGAHD